MRNGTAYRLPPLTHPTSVIASGSSRLWPTLHGTANPENPRRQGPSGNELGRAVLEVERSFHLAPTLTAREWRDCGAPSEYRRKSPRGTPLTLALLPTLTASRRSGLQSHGQNAFLGSLNPTWAEWFMGLPIGWSASTPSET